MNSKKNLTITAILLFFIILIPFVKNKTRSIEKNIAKHELKIKKLESNLFEAQLEYSYLSSPEIISRKIYTHLDDDYSYFQLSQIYFDIDQFLAEHRKITKVLENEIQKK
tara:strand:- start:36 stop:365 length:330 start_codon:yes stop_codon:yes gene_type:complete